MSTIDKLKEFRDRIYGDVFPVEITELSETWYFNKEVSGREFQRMADAGAKGELAACVEVILLLAKDQAGKRLFMDTHRPDVEALPTSMLVRVARLVQPQLNLPTTDEAQKK